MADADWRSIRREYITGDLSQRKLAKKHNVTDSTLNRKALAENWDAERAAYRAESGKKIIEAVSDNEAKIAAAKSETRLRLWEVVKRRAENISDETEEADVRRCIQNYVDLITCDPATDSEDTESSGLIEALNAQAGELFDDGDDSDFLNGGAEE